MEVSSLRSRISASDLPLERLAASTQVSDREKVAEVSRQFESVLLKQILSQAQKPLFQTNLASAGGSSTAIYQDMIAQQLADRISHGGSFGFARVLEKQLDARYLKKHPTDANGIGGADSKDAHMAEKKALLESLASQSELKRDHARPQPGKRI